MSKLSMLRFGIRFCRQLAIPIFALVFISLIYSSLLFALPFLNIIIYDKLLLTYDNDLLIQILFCIGALVLMNTVTNVSISLVTVFIRSRLAELIRVDFLRQMIHYPYAFFTDHRQGDMIQRLVNDVDIFASSYSLLIQGGAYLVQILFLLTMILFLDYSLFPVFVAGICIFFSWLYLNKIPLGKLDARARALGDLVYNQISSCITGIKQIKIFSMYSHQTFMLQGYLQELKKVSLQKSFFVSLSGAGSQISKLLFIVITAICFFKIRSGEMTVGHFFMFAILSSIFIYPISFLFQLSGHYEAGRVSYERLSILQKEPEQDGSVRFVELKHSILIRDVFFAYPGGRNILSGINLEISKGDSIAFIGASGSGKSTLTSLLMRLYKPTSGVILLDGQDIQNFTLDSLRERIGFFSQDTFLFNSSIADNVDPKSLYPTTDREHALRVAQLPQFVDKMQYQVGEAGGRLSGGERQRLALARLLLRDCDIIILDEATSNLDPQTADAFMLTLTAIRRELPHKTFITITHNYAQLDSMNQIFAFKDGKVEKTA